MYPTVQELKTAKPVTISTLKNMRQSGDKIACLTAYDASFAQLQDIAGVDVVLVGDSLGMVIQGQATTVPVSVDDIVYHSKAVSRGLHRALMIADLPFMSYATLEQAVHNSARLMQEGGAQMVKLEGNALQADIVEYLSSRGVPVCAHIGLCPQSVHKLGGYRVQGKEGAAAEAMLKDAEILEQAGADMLLVECVPNSLAKRITEQANVPVIGIGAGVDCDGQILVAQDMLGMNLGHLPKFAKNFMTDADGVRGAFEGYVAAVKNASYPSAEHSFGG